MNDFEYMQEILSRYASMYSAPISLEFGRFRPEPPKATPPTPTQAVLDELHRLNKEGADLSPVSETVKRIQNENKDRVLQALRGMTDMALIEGTKSRRFVLAYFEGKESHVIEGIEYPNTSGEDDEDRVSLEETESLYRCYDSMPKLREHLEAKGIVYHIAYFDK